MRSRAIRLIQLRLHDGSQVVLEAGEVRAQIQFKGLFAPAAPRGRLGNIPGATVSATGWPAISTDTGTGGISNAKSAPRAAAGNTARTIHVRRSIKDVRRTQAPSGFRPESGAVPLGGPPGGPPWTAADALVRLPRSLAGNPAAGEAARPTALLPPSRRSPPRSPATPWPPGWAHSARAARWRAR